MIHPRLMEDTMGRWMTGLGLLASMLAGCGKDAETADTDGPEHVGDTAEPDDALDVSGTWMGDCAGDFAGTGSTSYPVEMAVVLELVESDGDVTGTVEVSGLDDYGDPATIAADLSGTRTGADLVLELVLSGGSSSSSTTGSYTLQMQIQFELALADDTLAGDLVYFPNGTFPTSTLACTLSR